MKDHAELVRVKELVRKEIESLGIKDFTLHELGSNGLWVKAVMNADQRTMLGEALGGKGIMMVPMGPSAFGVAVVDP